MIWSFDQKQVYLQYNYIVVDKESVDGGKWIKRSEKAAVNEYLHTPYLLYRVHSIPTTIMNLSVAKNDIKLGYDN